MLTLKELEYAGKLYSHLYNGGARIFYKMSPVYGIRLLHNEEVYYECFDSEGLVSSLPKNLDLGLCSVQITLIPFDKGEEQSGHTYVSINPVTLESLYTQINMLQIEKSIHEEVNMRLRRPDIDQYDQEPDFGFDSYSQEPDFDSDIDFEV